MNYIVFKGICSKDIDGLLISELPPITMPKMRTSITKIDGRDEDIIDELGYESYTKTITIGLRRKFSIDEVINYFSGQGDLIMSNEPDKVYKAHVIEDADFERLVKFRTAKIKFHIQPFKFLVDEPPFIFDITNQKSVKVSNLGYVTSKPKMILYGSGIISVSINNVETFKVEIDDEYVVIDSLKQDAYKDLILKNRMMTGEFPIFNSGINIISWTGDLKKLVVYSQSRWL